jgi:chromate reductase
MSKIFRIVGISGSLRKDSWNTKLLKAFAVAASDAEFVQKGVQFEIADWSKYLSTPFSHGSADDRLPVYNGDLEANVPAPVLEFKKTVASADGIIIVTPEYKYSYIASFSLLNS